LGVGIIALLLRVLLRLCVSRGLLLFFHHSVVFHFIGHLHLGFDGLVIVQRFDLVSSGIPRLTTDSLITVVIVTMAVVFF
jgi:hypothetical protein